jgi:hypothetical protein
MGQARGPCWWPARPPQPRCRQGAARWQQACSTGGPAHLRGPGEDAHGQRAGRRRLHQPLVQDEERGGAQACGEGRGAGGGGTGLAGAGCSLGSRRSPALPRGFPNHQCRTAPGTSLPAGSCTKYTATLAHQPASQPASQRRIQGLGHPPASQPATVCAMRTSPTASSWLRAACTGSRPGACPSGALAPSASGTTCSGAVQAPLSACAAGRQVQGAAAAVEVLTRPAGPACRGACGAAPTRQTAGTGCGRAHLGPPVRHGAHLLQRGHEGACAAGCAGGARQGE